MGYDSGMKRTPPASWILAGLLLSPYFHPAWAGTAIQAQLLNPFNPAALTSLDLSVDNDKARVDFKGPSAHGSLIYDRESSLLTLVDHVHQVTYQVGSAELMALKIAGNLAFSNLVEKWSRSGNPNHRNFEQAKASMAALFNGTPVLKTQGASKDGFTCDEYRTRLAGRNGRDVWVTSPDIAGMGAEDFNTCRSFVHLALDLFGDALSQMGADTLSFQQKLDGQVFPVHSEVYVKGRMTGLFRVKSIASRSFAAGFFDPPSRYALKGIMDWGK